MWFDRHVRLIDRKTNVFLSINLTQRLSSIFMLLVSSGNATTRLNAFASILTEILVEHHTDKIVLKKGTISFYRKDPLTKRGEV